MGVIKIDVWASMGSFHASTQPVQINEWIKFTKDNWNRITAIANGITIYEMSELERTSFTHDTNGVNIPSLVQSCVKSIVLGIKQEYERIKPLHSIYVAHQPPYPLIQELEEEHHGDEQERTGGNGLVEEAVAPSTGPTPYVPRKARRVPRRTQRKA